MVCLMNFLVKVLEFSNIFRAFEGREKVRFMFRRPKSNMKRKCYIFSSYKQGNKVCLVYLEPQLEPDRSCLLDFQVKMQENGRKNIFRDKQRRNKVLMMFLDIKVLRER